MKKILLASVALFAMTGSAFAACTQEAVQAKSTEFTTKLQQVITKDPSKAQKWQQRTVEMAKEAQGISNENACDYMDKMIKEVEADL